MADLFFYGTLCHVPLLERVLGRSGIGLVPASLPDHTAVWAEGEAFPLLVPAPGQAAEGLLAAGLSEEDIARLVFYEGGFEFGVEQLTVLAAQGEVRANVFYGEPGRWTSPRGSTPPSSSALPPRRPPPPPRLSAAATRVTRACGGGGSSSRHRNRLGPGVQLLRAR